MDNTPAPHPDPKTASKRACPEPGASPSRRGGKRPGAGAPKGNLNALKHGRRSRVFAQIGAVLSINPVTRDALLALAQRYFQDQATSEDVAVTLFTRLFEHAESIARGEPSRGPFAHLLNENPQHPYIKQLKDAQSSPKRPRRPRSSTKTPRKTKNAAAQSTTQREPPTQSDPRYKNRAQRP